MRLRPDPDASNLADEMAGMDDVMYAVLDETIPSEQGAEVTESGRTLCGSGDVHGPLARFPSAVELASCPRNASGGTWHTHVTKDQLRDPTNSLPDTANVIFGEMDVSAVVGTRSMEMVVAPADAEAGRETFRDALGADVDTTDDVVDAIMDGTISDPGDARARVKRRMSGLFQRRSLNFRELDDRLNTSSIPAHSPMHFEQVEAMHYMSLYEAQSGSSSTGTCSKFRSRVRSTNRAAKSVSEQTNAKKAVVSSVVGATVSHAVRRVLPF